MNVFKTIGKVAVGIVTLPVKIVAGIVLLNKFKDQGK